MLVLTLLKVTRTPQKENNQIGFDTTLLWNMKHRILNTNILICSSVLHTVIILPLSVSFELCHARKISCLLIRKQVKWLKTEKNQLVLYIFWNLLIFGGYVLFLHCPKTILMIHRFQDFHTFDLIFACPVNLHGR